MNIGRTREVITPGPEKIMLWSMIGKTQEDGQVVKHKLKY